MSLDPKQTAPNRPPIRLGDCLDVLPTLGLASFDSCVTDPPYGLSFMGKAWDRGVPGPMYWAHVLRVVKPGGYLLAFGGTRTYHRLACAIEDAGWELHDCLCWLYGSGFPKHASKLKPAWEPVIMARRPASVATALRIDDCRIPVEDASYARNASGDRGHGGTREHGEATDIRAGGGSAHDGGRWPANVVIDEEAAATIDEQSGVTASRSARRGLQGRHDAGTNEKRNLKSYTDTVRGHNDSGGASRFYYCAKASRTERDAGLDTFDELPLHWSSGDANPGAFQSEGTKKSARNNHPTVKPIALMRWLTRLVTPIGGSVLDPFAGSGTTGCAASLEGFAFTGIEQDERFARLSNARIAHWSEGVA